MCSLIDVFVDLGKHPQHTSQSWRNRWVKVLSNRSPREEQTSPPTRQSFGFTREQDEIILKVVRQPGADPENPEFWERIALTVIPTLVTNKPDIARIHEP